MLAELYSNKKRRTQCSNLNEVKSERKTKLLSKKSKTSPPTTKYLNEFINHLTTKLGSARGHASSAGTNQGPATTHLDLHTQKKNTLHTKLRNGNALHSSSKQNVQEIFTVCSAYVQIHIHECTSTFNTLNTVFCEIYNIKYNHEKR